MTDTLLEIEDLHVDFQVDRAIVRAVDGLSLSVAAGERVGIVGESGSGKSATALSVMRLIEKPGTVRAKVMRFRGTDLLTLSRRQLDDVRGAGIAMVFQDPLTALDPVFTVGQQIVEVIQRHQPDVTKTEARSRAKRLLVEVGLPDPDRCLRSYAHQLSGGIRQRSMIASALAADPLLLIADEPTTALDVTVQAQILDLLARLADERRMAVILITHDLGVLAGFTQRVVVMYAGRAVEIADVQSLFRNPRHPYTVALLGSVTRLDRPLERDLPAIPGAPPNLARLPPGCPFAPRCAYAQDDCRVDRPELRPVGRSVVACHHPMGEGS